MALEKVSDFKERLKIALSDDISASDLATKISMSRQAISAYTTGVRIPKRPVINAIADALSVNPMWLLGYDVPKEHHLENTTEQQLLTKQEAAVKIQDLLVNKGVIPPEGDLSNEQTEILLNYISANADFLKQLLHGSK